LFGLRPQASAVALSHLLWCGKGRQRSYRVARLERVVKHEGVIEDAGRIYDGSADLLKLWEKEGTRG
jgi:hypothetical protein